MKSGDLVRLLPYDGALGEVLDVKGDVIKCARIVGDELDSVAVDLDRSEVEVPVHYTISQGGDGTYVVGHSLGEGWVRRIVELKEGDTADNPASTKGPIYGPALVVYDCARSGITVGLYDGAEAFYKDLYETRAASEARPRSVSLADA